MILSGNLNKKNSPIMLLILIIIRTIILTKNFILVSSRVLEIQFQIPPKSE